MKGVTKSYRIMDSDWADLYPEVILHPDKIGLWEVITEYRDKDDGQENRPRPSTHSAG